MVTDCFRYAGLETPPRAGALLARRRVMAARTCGVRMVRLVENLMELSSVADMRVIPSNCGGVIRFMMRMCRLVGVCEMGHYAVQCKQNRKVGCSEYKEFDAQGEGL